MANPSLAEAIGLQAQPNWGIAERALARADAAETARARARAAQKAKEDEDFNKLLKEKDVTVDKTLYHNVYIPAAEATAKDGFSKAYELHRTDPSNLQAVYEVLKNTQSKLNVYKNESDILKQQDKDVAEGKVHADPSYMNAVHSGNYSDVSLNPQTGMYESAGWAKLEEAAKANPYYQHSFDSHGRVDYNPVEIFDLGKEKSSFISSPTNWTDVTEKSVTSHIPGQVEVKKVSETNPFARSMKADEMMNNPKKLQSVLIQLQPQIENAVATKDPSIIDPITGSITPESRNNWVKGFLINNVLKQTREDLSHFALAKETGDQEKTKQTPTLIKNQSVPVSVTRVEGGPVNYIGLEGKAYQKSSKEGQYIEVGTNKNVDKKTAFGDNEPTEITSGVKGEWVGESAYPLRQVSVQISSPKVIDLEAGKSVQGTSGMEYRIDNLIYAPYGELKNGEIYPIRGQFAKPTDKRAWFAVGNETTTKKDGTQQLAPRAIPVTPAVLEQLKKAPKNAVNVDIPENELYGGKGSTTSTKTSTTTKPKEDLRNKYGY
jgi:hypothetical protein